MTTSPTVRMLGFVNHIPPAPDIEESIARALDWVVDVIEEAACPSPSPASDSPPRALRPKAGSMQLHEYASIIRSKNAGPFCLTIDVFFADAGGYALARRSDLLTVPGVARACGELT